MLNANGECRSNKCKNFYYLRGVADESAYGKGKDIVLYGKTIMYIVRYVRTRGKRSGSYMK